MPRVPLQQLAEVFRTSTELSEVVSRAVRDGEARKIHGRLYTTDVVESPEAIVRRNLWRVVSLLFPGAVVSHRTALEMRPSPGWTVFLTGASNRLIELPGRSSGCSIGRRPSRRGSISATSRWP